MKEPDGLCPTGYFIKAQTLQQWIEALQEIQERSGVDPTQVAITHIAGGINKDWVSLVRLKEFNKKPVRKRAKK